MERLHLHITGRVQGVFFRDSTRKKAQQLDINGWIRNLPDGRVEAVFEGPPEQLEKMIDYCHHGPPQARVEKVEIEQQEPQGLTDFTIKR